MKINNNYVIAGLTCIIAILLMFNIFRNPAPAPNNNEEKMQELLSTIKKQKQIIKDINQEISQLKDDVSILTLTNDSLSNIKQTVKHHYHEIYLDISNSNNLQLDSIIRANW